jgi:hypothetical protein
MAFLGDIGKVFGLGSSKQVLGDVGAFFGSGLGVEGAGRRAGEAFAGATQGLSTADQPAEQSAVPTGDPKQGMAQETSRSGSQTVNIIDTARGNGMTSQAGLGLLSPLLQSAGKFLSSRTGQIATGVGTGALFSGGGQDGRMRPVLTQSRRNKAKVRQLVNFMGIEGAANFLSQSIGQDVSPNDVVMLLLRTFRNDGAYITKAQVRNLRRTTNRFKSLEKQVKEATSMSRTTRRAPVRRASSTTLIKN